MRLNFGKIIKERADCFFHDDPVASMYLDEFDKFTNRVAIEHVQEVALKDDLMLFLIDDELADELFSGGVVFKETDFSVFGVLDVNGLTHFV
jgi:hypothetical protein